MPSFETSALAAEWPVLLECASPSCDPRRLLDLLGKKPDWSVLLSLAEEHGVLGLLAERLHGDVESKVPKEVRLKLHENQRALGLFTLRLTAELFRLLQSFSAAGMEALVVKGPVLSARAYGDSCVRQYEDVDLLVRQRDVLRFTELMMGEGYAPKIPLSAIRAGKVPGEYVFRWPGTNRRIELHTEQTLRYFPRPLPAEQFFRRKVLVEFDGHTAPALCTEDELVLICVHSAKHFWGRLIWVADVAGLVSRQMDLDWEQVFTAALEVGAMRMLSVGLLLARDFFQLELPGEVERVIRPDRGAARLADEIAARLSSSVQMPRELLARAFFRVRMGGGLVAGIAYFLRLTLSPTEEDWSEEHLEEQPGLFDLLRRPMRLARKYWHGGEE